jgi:hypothetical protein
MLSIFTFIAYLLTGLNCFGERTIENDLLPVLAISSFYIVTLTIGLYFLRTESAFQSGIWKMLTQGSNLDRQEKLTSLQSVKALRESLLSAGFFVWAFNITALSRGNFSIDSMVSYQDLAVFFMFMPLVIMLVFEDLLRIVCRFRALTEIDSKMNKSWLQIWAFMLLICFLIIQNLFPDNFSEKAMIVISSVPISLVFTFVWFYLKSFFNNQKEPLKA